MTLPSRLSQWLFGIIFVLWCAVVRSDCDKTNMPPLLGCFRDQPPLGSHSCYKFGKDPNGTSIIECASPQVGAQPYDAVERCKSNQWESANINSCVVGSDTVWRLVLGESTVRGWWVHELQFYQDSLCRKPVAPADVSLYFASGPSGAQNAPPTEAFDGNSANWWRAPCAGSDTFDFCGCRSDLGEGWSHTLQRCMVGSTTDGNAERECIASGRAVGANAPTLGCPGGRTALGIHLAAPQKINCVRLHQYSTDALSARSVTLETWSSGSWQAVKTFTGLKGGSSQILQVKNSCPPYQLPNYVSRWTQIRGASTEASDGDERTVECIDGSQQATVICLHGKWTDLPLISCFQPSIPSLASKSSSKKADGSALSPGVEMILWLLGCVFGVAIFLVSVYTGQRWWQQHEWKRFLREGPWEGGVPAPEQVHRPPIDWARELKQSQLRDAAKQSKSASMSSSASKGQHGKAPGNSQMQTLGANKFQRLPSIGSNDSGEFEEHNLRNPTREKPRFFHGPPADFAPNQNRFPPVPPPPLPSLPPGAQGNLRNAAHSVDHAASSPNVELTPQRKQQGKAASHESPGQSIGNWGNSKNSADAGGSGFGVASVLKRAHQSTPQRNQQDHLAPNRSPMGLDQEATSVRVTGQSWRASRTPQPGPSSSPHGFK